MTALPPWHPMLVHFPLALVLTAAVAFGVAAALREPRHASLWAGAATLNLCLGAVATLFAIGSGLGAAIGLSLADAARAALSLHVKWAMGASFCAIGAAVWRIAGAAPGDRPSRAFLAIMTLTALLLVGTGYRGGLNVYRYGIGVAASAAY